MWRVGLLPVLLLIVAVTPGSKPAAAQGNSLQTLASQSRAIFQGRVTRVDYRNSIPDATGRSLPYTLVTYRVERVVAGSLAGNTFVLRFRGGSDGRGSFTSISNVPRFQPGEEDLLFVDGNGDDGDCPLVQCLGGRIRILDGRAYDGHGSPIQSIADGVISAKGPRPAAFRQFRYPAPVFDELMKNSAAQARLRQLGMSVAEARELYRREAPKEILMETVQSLPSDERARLVPALGNSPRAAPVEAEDEGSGEPIGVEQIVAAAAAAGAEQARRAAPLRGANPNAAIRTTNETSVAPPSQ